MHDNFASKPWRYALGMMSGTSGDGVDLVLADLAPADGARFQILKCSTEPYPENWAENLRFRPLSAEAFLDLDHNLGLYLGACAQKFLAQAQAEGLPAAQFIASHGHTWFHQPALKRSYQLGCGPEISLQSGLICVNDFRRSDVLRGGQGAPLVPIGDRDLFPEFEACLNLGGFANVSFMQKGPGLAYDIAPLNLGLNRWAQKLGLPFDRDGAIAAQNSPDPGLVAALDALPYYQQKGPKSLGIEWLDQVFWPCIESFKPSPEVAISSLSEHSARQIARQLKQEGCQSALVTGGGAHNKHLINRIETHWGKALSLPSPELIDFKEALVFAYLGSLCLQGRVNVLAAVTGADCDHCSGQIYRV